MSVIIAILAFLAALMVLIIVHEFGHFWVAKKLGIKVLRFSVGFGKIIKSFKRGETEYTLCALPFGGFVKMLDENEGEVADAEKSRAFNRQNVYKRFLVVAAGPAANFIFAILAYAIIFYVGSYDIRPIIGEITPQSIAAKADFEVGSQIKKVQGKNISGVSEFHQAIISALDSKEIIVQTSKNNQLKNRTLKPDNNFFQNPEQGLNKYLGFEFQLPKLAPIIAEVLKNSAAESGGLKAQDQIISANSEPINNWLQFVKIIQKNPNKTIDLKVLRAETTLNLSLIPQGKNGEAKIGVRVFVPENHFEKWQVPIKKNLPEAFFAANQKVADLLVLNFIVVKKMLTGQASIRQISGPISIANYAGKTAEIGFIAFLSFMALISVSLGFLNILPIPVLDGGHLAFYIIEIIKGSAVGQKTQQLSLKIGLIIIILLSVSALYNDLLRLL